MRSGVKNTKVARTRLQMSGACLGRRMGARCRKEVNPLLQKPPSIIQRHIGRIPRGQGCLHVPDLPSPPHNGGQAHTSIRAKIAVAEPIILFTAKIRTTSNIEGILHPCVTCMKRCEVVCNVLHTVKLAVPAQTLHPSEPPN